MTDQNEKKDKITIGTLCSWGFGGFLFLGGVFGMFEEPVLGICALLASALLLPPIRDIVYQKTNKSLSFGVRFILVTTLIAIGGSTLPDTVTAGTENSGGIMATLSKIDDRGLNVTGLKLTRGQYGNQQVTGMLENTNNKQYSYVQVEINLYDKEGIQIGSTLANANHLEPNGKWRFKAVVLEGSAVRAKLKGVTAF